MQYTILQTAEERLEKFLFAVDYFAAHETSEMIEHILASSISMMRTESTMYAQSVYFGMIGHRR